MEQRRSSGERSNWISKLLTSRKSRAAYIRAKLGVLVPAQIRSLRIKSTNPAMPRQKDLATEAEMQQSRISMFETPGAANITLSTIAEVGAALKCGVIVKFVPFSEMLKWENEFPSGEFDVTRLDQDEAFLNPESADAKNVATGTNAISGVGALVSDEAHLDIWKASGSRMSNRINENALGELPDVRISPVQSIEKMELSHAG